MNDSLPPAMGDYACVQIAGQGGRIIRALQGLYGSGFSDYEHALIYIGGGAIIEMAAGGIQVARLSKYASTPQAWSTGRIILTNEQRHDIVSAAQGYLALHVQYSWEDYAAMALHHWGLNNAALRAYIASTRHMICSQLVDQCYADAGVHLFRDNRWPGYVTPGDLWLRLQGSM